MAPPLEQYDVVIASELCFQGGSATSIAEEIRAQARAGYSTALIQLDAPKLTGGGRRNPVNRRIVDCLHTGLATLVSADREISADALIVRYPPVLTAPVDLRVVAKSHLLIANQPWRDGTCAPDQPHYDVERVDRNAEALFGTVPVWAPIGPLMRRNLAEASYEVMLTESDWVNIIDVDEWATDRTRFVADRPVIGRHSRPQPVKWPDSAQATLQAYPDDPEFEVKLLGGERVADLVGVLPENWTVYPFGTRDPREFLTEIDFFVYFHHPGWIEAFGRTIIEALASGTPAILHPSARVVFGDSCLYTEPAGVRDLVRTLYQDKAAYIDQVERGWDFVREHFGYEVHRARLERLTGDTSPRARTSRAERRSTPRHRVAFVTGNGTGIGHLTRCLACAKRLPLDVDAVFFTLSLAFARIRDAGFICEFIPRYYSEWKKPVREAMLARRLADLIRHYRVDAVVFDLGLPFDGLVGAKEEAGIPFIWMRRGMWMPGRGTEHFRNAHIFDMVIEPGDWAAAHDRGLTAERRDEVLAVEPVVLVDRSEVLDRAAARSELGLSSRSTAVLVALGGNPHEEDAGFVDGLIARLTADEATELVFADWDTSVTRTRLPSGVKQVSIYPLSRYFAAFDYAIAAAGYNTFHELVVLGVPTIFVPMRRKLDDQAARAQFAEDAGVSVVAPIGDLDRLDECLAAMRNERCRAAMAERARATTIRNGAFTAAEAIADMARGSPPAIPGPALAS